MGEKDHTHTLERGDIYFFYRPKVIEADTKAHPHGIEDIQRFYIILHPENSPLFRLLLVGRKRLPDAKDHEKNWVQIELVTPERKEILDRLKEERYQTKTQGKRINPSIRAIGEGVYSIVASGHQTYLSYELELPEQPGEVQKELNLESEASFVISVKNQEIAGIQGSVKANFPKDLQALFRDRRFIAIESIEFLNYANAELLLVGAHSAIPKKLRANLEPEPEECINSAEIFDDLRLWMNEHTTAPLIEGVWN